MCEILITYFVLCDQVITSWYLSTAVIGARGDLKDIPKMRVCPACLDITDEVFDLTLPHVLQV